MSRILLLIYSFVEGLLKAPNEKPVSQTRSDCDREEEAESGFGAPFSLCRWGRQVGGVLSVHIGSLFR